MKTAEEKAIEWLDGLMPGFDERYHEDEVDSLTKLLKEQDRDTRHACAEAVANISTTNFSTHIQLGVAKAYDACMNVKAV